MSLYRVTLTVELDTYAKSPEEARKQAISAIRSEWTVASLESKTVAKVEISPRA